MSGEFLPSNRQTDQEVRHPCHLLDLLNGRTLRSSQMVPRHPATPPRDTRTLPPNFGRRSRGFRRRKYACSS